MNFGEKLRTLRKARGISQGLTAQELASLFPDLAISQTYLSTLENSVYAPRQEVVNCFAAYYDVPVLHFYTDNSTTQHISIRAYVEGLRHHTPDSSKRFAPETRDTVTEDISDLSYLDSD